MSVNVGKVFLTLKRQDKTLFSCWFASFLDFQRVQLESRVPSCPSQPTTCLHIAAVAIFWVFVTGFITHLSSVAAPHSLHFNSQRNTDWNRGSTQVSIASRSGKANTGVSSFPEQHKQVWLVSFLHPPPHFQKTVVIVDSGRRMCSRRPLIFD